MGAVREAFVSGGVVYHHALVQPGQPFHAFEIVDLCDLAATDLNRFDLVVVPRSTDGEVLRARRYQVARFLDHGGVLVTFGEQWAEWFPGCQWEPECPADILAPVPKPHPFLDPFSVDELYWHPAYHSWCCHGHLVAPRGAEVIVENARGDAWLYVDRTSSNGVIVAATNLDPDTHAYHGNQQARLYLEQLLAWARDEAAQAAERRQRQPKKIAGLYSGVHFQRSFYEETEFAPDFAVLPVWELGAANLHDFAALWIPRESNQNELMRQRDKIARYLREGGTLVCWEQANQPWLPVGEWELRPVNLDTVRVAAHPTVAHLSPEQVGWHSHGAYRAYEGATVLVDDSEGNVMLFEDRHSFAGRLLAGTMDPDCHAGFGSQRTHPLLHAILAWVHDLQLEAASGD